MFEKFLGLPLHPLVVHAAVVFVPLLVIAGIGYASVPGLRRRLGWAALLLSVVAPAAALVAKKSGEKLQSALIAKHYGPEILAKVAEHQGYGNRTFWFTLGLGLSTGLLVLATSGHPRVADLPTWVRPLLAAGVVVFGVLSAVYVYLTGESGATAVWTGVL